jgi:hypothetical protein
MNKTIKELARSTGFPPQALTSFTKNGLLPSSKAADQPLYNGLALLSSLEQEVYFG